MKKNILSLVAFMAFSVGAFANTIEIKEEVVEVNQIEEVGPESDGMSSIFKNKCISLFFNVLVDCSDYMEQGDAAEIAALAYNKCVGGEG